MSIDDGRPPKTIPEHLRRWPGLYVREQDRIVEAPEADCLVAQSYPHRAEKGPIRDGKRLTLITKKGIYEVSEQVRVIHVVEVVEPGHSVYVMGPKEVYGEYLDGKPVTAPSPSKDDPPVPRTSNGAVLPSPAVDYNWDITSYTFNQPGLHEIHWELGSLRSNVLKIEIVSTGNSTS